MRKTVMENGNTKNSNEIEQLKLFKKIWNEKNLNKYLNIDNKSQWITNDNDNETIDVSLVHTFTNQIINFQLTTISFNTEYYKTKTNLSKKIKNDLSKNRSIIKNTEFNNLNHFLTNLSNNLEEIIKKKSKTKYKNTYLLILANENDLQLIDLNNSGNEGINHFLCFVEIFLRSKEIKTDIFKKIFFYIQGNKCSSVTSHEKMQNNQHIERTKQSFLPFDYLYNINYLQPTFPSLHVKNFDKNYKIKCSDYSKLECNESSILITNYRGKQKFHNSKKINKVKTVNHKEDEKNCDGKE